MTVESQEIPTLSVIISLKNDSKSLCTTLESLLLQDYKKIEVIIQDSNSKDHPYKVANSFLNRGLNIVFESSYDSSIYEAWNKAIEKVRSKYLTFVGAGDIMIEGALNELIEVVQLDQSVDVLTSQSIDIYPNNLQIIRGLPFSPSDFNKKFIINHTGVIYKTVIFHKFGNFSLDYRFSSDYEFLLRIAPHVNISYVKLCVSKYIYGGASSSSLRPIFESYNIRKKYKTISKPDNFFVLLRAITSFIIIRLIVKYLPQKISQFLLRSAWAK